MQLKDLGNLTSVYDEIKTIGTVIGITDQSSVLLKNTFKELSEKEIGAKLATSGLSNELKQQIGSIVGV